MPNNECKKKDSLAKDLLANCGHVQRNRLRHGIFLIWDLACQLGIV